MIALSKTSYKLFFIPRRTENDAFVHNKIKQICNQIMLVLSKTKTKKIHKKICASNVFSIRVKRKMQKRLIIKQRSSAADNQILEWHQKGTFNFTKVVNNHQLRRRAASA